MAADAGRRDPAQPGGGGAEIPIHPLIRNLVGESGEPQALVTMVGYIGPSKREGHVRLYTGLDFQTYYEVPRDRVASVQAVDREDENSPSRVLIGADATVELVQTSRQSGPASYLAGAIAGTFLAGAAAGQGGIVYPNLTRVSLCGGCPSLFIACTLTQPGCCIPPSSPPICPIPSGFICGGGIPDPGPVEEQARIQAQAQAVYPRPSILCPSYAIPCITRWWYHCPTRLCPLPQAEEQAAAPQAAMGQIYWPTIYCSYFGGCRTQYAPCNTPHCPMAQVAAPEAAAAQAAADPAVVWQTLYYICRSVFYPCLTHYHCPTPRCPLAEAAGPQGFAPGHEGPSILPSC